MQYRLRTLLIVLAIGPAFLWTAHRNLLPVSPAVTVKTPAEFHALMSSGSVIVHLDVDWSTDAQASRLVIASFRRRMASDSRCSTILFRRVDCTSNDTPLYRTTKGWLGGQNANWIGLRGGYGALLWIKDGQLMDSLRCAANENADELFARTLTAFTTK